MVEGTWRVYAAAVRSHREEQGGAAGGKKSETERCAFSVSSFLVLSSARSHAEEK